MVDDEDLLVGLEVPVFEVLEHLLHHRRLGICVLGGADMFFRLIAAHVVIEVVVVEQLIDRLLHLLVDLVAQPVELFRIHLCLAFARALGLAFGGVDLADFRNILIVVGLGPMQREPLRREPSEFGPGSLRHRNRASIDGPSSHFQTILIILFLNLLIAITISLLRTDVIIMRPFEPVQPIKLVNAVYIPSFDQQIVYLFLEDVIFGDDAVQDLLEEHDEARPVVDLLIGRPEEGHDLEDARCDAAQYLLVGEVKGHLVDHLLDDPPACPLREP